MKSNHEPDPDILAAKKQDNLLFQQLQSLLTEQRNPRTMTIDTADPLEIVRLINREDRDIGRQVGKKCEEIATAVEWISEAISDGGRLLYFGAGTSGRLGVLDAAECPPTFGTDPELVRGFIAGGEDAMFTAKEGVEDFESNGADAVGLASAAKPDVVCGIAASGRTPYVHGAIKEARRRGCKTVLVTTVSSDQVNLDADLIIDVPVGPEVIMGSTRMKSATAQKMILNMLTTGAMIRLGKIYENVMVDLQLSNKKLEERAKRIIIFFTGLTYDASCQLLEASGGHVKTALVMGLTGLNRQESKALLDEHQGFIRRAIESLEKE